MKIECLIVEDEPIAAEILKKYISQVPYLNLKGECTDAIYALEFLKKEKVDLIFLDIHLPKLKGIEFIKFLVNPPQIIITTAYNDYAVQGFELNVLDYLVKPIEFSRFLLAVNRVHVSQKSNIQVPEFSEIENRSHVFFNIDKKKIKVYLDEILYFESMREYVKVITKTKTLTVHTQIGQIEQQFDKTRFIRIHRSFIVSRTEIESYTSSEVEIMNKHIPIGRNFKELVMNILER